MGPLQGISPGGPSFGGTFFLVLWLQENGLPGMEAEKRSSMEGVHAGVPWLILFIEDMGVC